MRPSPLSVTELNEYVRRSLAGDPMLQGIAIRGEISNFKKHYSGHLYFTLKDEASRINCVMFRQYAQMLRFTPEDGMNVLLSGSVSLYAATGAYQFYGEAMAAQGAGALYELFIRTRERLQKEGLFDTSLKKPLPLLPKGIGIVTSASGAVLHDIKTVAGRRFPGIPLYLRAAQVQGEGAAEDLARALRELDALPEIDVIIIGRGGGSLEDLWAFNEEALVRAVADCRKPVISAVGHETDVTLTDFAADVRAPTPSAAAELAVPPREDLLQKVNVMFSQLSALAAQKLSALGSRLDAALSRLELNSPLNRVGMASLRLESCIKSMHRAAESALFEKSAAAKQAGERLRVAGPEQTLRRGYVIAMDGAFPVTSISEVRDELTLVFRDGRALMKTLRIEKEEGT